MSQNIDNTNMSSISRRQQTYKQNSLDRFHVERKHQKETSFSPNLMTTPSVLKSLICSFLTTECVNNFIFSSKILNRDRNIFFSQCENVKTISIENKKLIRYVIKCGAKICIKGNCNTTTECIIKILSFGSINSLYLSFTKVVDVSALGGVHTLNLSYTK